MGAVLCVTSSTYDILCASDLETNTHSSVGCPRDLIRTVPPCWPELQGYHLLPCMSYRSASPFITSRDTGTINEDRVAYYTRLLKRYNALRLHKSFMGDDIRLYGNVTFQPLRRLAFWCFVRPVVKTIISVLVAYIVESTFLDHYRIQCQAASSMCRSRKYSKMLCWGSVRCQYCTLSSETSLVMPCFKYSLRYSYSSIGHVFRAYVSLTLGGLTAHF